MFSKIKNGINSLKDGVHFLINQAMTTLKSKKAEGYVDSGVKILISVVIGALLLAGLYSLFNDTIMPTVTQKVVDLFNYKG